ncbi:unnamed protein product, partial [Gulo gulo]
SIYQSLTAEAIFRKLVTDPNVFNKRKVDSATTSKNETENPPDYQRHNGMKGHGSAMNRIVQAGDQEDFATFDYILCMEESNLKDLNRKRKQVKNGKAKIEPLGAIIRESDISLKIPIVRVTPASRLSTSSV